ncbi:MAG: 50S ribosome-binding GTPase [Nanoarchaeota archaeon]|nr:50S ribosome-binding GTPase [Nanoarchaeota archaeon]
MADEEKSTNNSRIKEFEDELKKTKYNKRTQQHIGLIKAKISALKEKEIKRGSGGGGPEGFHVRKTGDGTVILIGFPSVGKSTLLNQITNASSKVGSYAFTTLDVVPGLLKHKSAKIQVLDVPGIVKGAASGRGRGKEVLSCAQSADLVLFIVDALHPENLPTLEKEAYDANLRINKKKPFVRITRTPRGGVQVGTTVRLTKTTEETIASVAKELRILNADILIRDDISVDDFIDVIEEGKRYVPGLVVLNKVDLLSKEKLAEVIKKVKPDICISAELGLNLDNLKDLIYERMELIRVYCKEVRKKADLDEPVIMFEDSTLKDVCEKLHRDFSDNFKFARIWGSSKFGGQVIRKLEYPLKDKDVVELHMR